MTIGKTKVISYNIVDLSLAFVKAAFWIRVIKHQGETIDAAPPHPSPRELNMLRVVRLSRCSGQIGEHLNHPVSCLPQSPFFMTAFLPLITSIRMVVVYGGYNGCDVGPCFTMVGADLTASKQAWSLLLLIHPLRTRQSQLVCSPNTVYIHQGRGPSLPTLIPTSSKLRAYFLSAYLLPRLT